MLLMENIISNNYFDKSVEIDHKALSLASTPDEKVNLLWSISETTLARGDNAAAIANMEQAINTVQSPALRQKLEWRLQAIEKL